MSANTDTELAAVKASLTSAEQLLAERDKTIAALERQVNAVAKIMNDLLVGNQSAWIEWQHGKGAEAAMEWVENSLAGCGTPEEDAPWSTDAQAWWSANKADPFPSCFCGRPSNILWMGRGFCCDAHYDKARALALTGSPVPVIDAQSLKPTKGKVVGWGAVNDEGDQGYRCPYGRPGDLLWVREAFAFTDAHMAEYECSIEYRADSKCMAIAPGPELVDVPHGCDPRPFAGPWKPSIHMPRWASRILLEIVSVRVERLNEISEADALAEGLTPTNWRSGRTATTSCAKAPMPAAAPPRSRCTANCGNRSTAPAAGRPTHLCGSWNFGG